MNKGTFENEIKMKCAHNLIEMVTLIFDNNLFFIPTITCISLKRFQPKEGETDPFHGCVRNNFHVQVDTTVCIIDGDFHFDKFRHSI